MRFLLLIGIACLFSCTQPVHLKTGVWRGVIELQGQELPFNFDVTRDTSGYKIYIKNAGERLLLDEVLQSGDSISIVLHIFDAEFRARITDGKLNGYYVKNFEKNYRLPFHAVWGEDFRFDKISEHAAVDFTGKYDVQFIHEKDTNVAVGIFNQHGNYVEGTFLLPDGDYRYLQGNVMGEKMWLSTFDGHHAYIFSATLKNKTTLNGEYWSGKSWYQSWVGVANENASLPDLESMTYLKKGYEKIHFSFPGINGEKISPADDRYKNKVLILQIFGTWCPNCMDETMFLTKWYDKNKDRGVEILGLAYERKDDFDYASSRVKKMKTKLGVHYDFVIAGTSDKVKASSTLPELNQLLAFPTTIFIGRDGKVKRIHTGFSGPGTGPYYEQFIERFNTTVNELLADKLTSVSNKE